MSTFSALHRNISRQIPLLPVWICSRKTARYLAVSLVFIFFVRNPVFLCAQSQLLDPEAPKLWAVGTPSGVALQWSLPTRSILPYSYTVQRSPALKNRFQTIGRVSRLQETLWQSLKLPISKDTLQSLINSASSERASPEIRRQALLKLHSRALQDPNSFGLILGLSFTDTSCKFSMAYDYRILVEGSLVSECSEIWPGKSSLPPIPTQIRAKPDLGCVHFSWSTDSAWLYGIRGCNVYRRTSDKEAFVRVNKSLALSIHRRDQNYSFSFFDDCGLNAGSAYEYALSSVDVFGRESLRSSVFSVGPSVTSPYPHARITQTEVNENRVTVHWRTSADSSISGFNLYRGLFGSGSKFKVNEQIISPLVRSFTDYIEDVPAEFITYSLSIVDRSGNEGRLSYEYRSPVIDRTPPLNADYFECSRSAGLVRLRWSTSPGRDVRGYELSRSLERDGPYDILMDLSEKNAYDDTVTAFASRSIWYRIRSADRRGNLSPWSEPVQAFSSIMNTIVAPNPMVAAAQIRLISLSWFPSQAPQISGYIINRYDDTTKAPKTITSSPLSANATEFTDSTAVPLKNYWYEIVCTDPTGELSQPSAKVPARSLLRPPPRYVKDLITPRPIRR